MGAEDNQWEPARLYRDTTPIEAPRLHSEVLTPASRWVGRTIPELPLGSDDVVTAVVHGQQRRIAPRPDTVLAVSDVLVVFGVPRDLENAHAAIA